MPKKGIITDKHLHIVSLNVPYPPDYGGVIDIFYKIKALQGNGIKVHLHCFEYGRSVAGELEEICEEVSYYKRKKGFIYQLSPSPYIVLTRSDEKLLQNLSKDDYPILFEGIHTTRYITHPSIREKKKYIRTHNIEHEYYRLLSQSEKILYKKFFLRMEAGKLRRFEKYLALGDGIFAISKNDFTHFNDLFGKTYFLPPFHPFTNVLSKPGNSDYILFHGDLTVSDNRNALITLIRHVFSKLNLKVKIAGKTKDDRLRNFISTQRNFELIENPDDEEMSQLIMNAQVIMLYTFQSTGMKLKLLSSLYQGRHCLVNPKMVENTGLSELCHIAGNFSEAREKVQELMQTEFDMQSVNERKKILNNQFCNMKNAERLTKFIFHTP
ncbi:MAG: glycosyltransferase family 1 protein [Bacteroidales bacterium]